MCCNISSPSAPSMASVCRSKKKTRRLNFRIVKGYRHNTYVLTKMTNNNYLDWLPDDLMSTIDTMAKRMAMADKVYDAITVGYDPKVGRPTCYDNTLVPLPLFGLNGRWRIYDTCCKHVMKAGPNRGECCGQHCIGSEGARCSKHIKRVDSAFGLSPTGRGRSGDGPRPPLHGTVLNGVVYKNHCGFDGRDWKCSLRLFDEAIKLGLCGDEMQGHMQNWSRDHGMGWAAAGVEMSHEVNRRLAAL